MVKQFYETNYSLAQRMLVLDVLVAAAKELSTISVCTAVGEGKCESSTRTVFLLNIIDI